MIKKYLYVILIFSLITILSIYIYLNNQKVDAFLKSIGLIKINNESYPESLKKYSNIQIFEVPFFKIYLPVEWYPLNFNGKIFLGKEDQSASIYNFRLQQDADGVKYLNIPQEEIVSQYPFESLIETRYDIISELINTPDNELNLNFAFYAGNPTFEENELTKIVSAKSGEFQFLNRLKGEENFIFIFKEKTSNNYIYIVVGNNFLSHIFLENPSEDTKKMFEDIAYSISTKYPKDLLVK